MNANNWGFIVFATAPMIVFLFVVLLSLGFFDRKKYKYSWLELVFADKWQWVRRRAGGYWVKDVSQIGAIWVKWTDEEMRGLQIMNWDIFNDSRYLTEDWRRK